jgi:membrane protease YdiL (CAAX protease family)
VSDIFIGRDGIRAGWRIAIFLLLLVVEGVMLFSIISVAGHLFPGFRRFVTGGALFTPEKTIFGESMFVAGALFAAWAMSLIEKRPMDAYGLPARSAFGGRFWEGAAWGFLAIAAVMGAIAASGDLQIDVASTGAAAAGGLLLWALAFIGVGLSEEFLFRGYLLFTLARGIGFWPAAAILGVIFALEHVFNPGETPVGIAGIVLFAIVFSFALWQTGSLWFGVGFHAAWDWGQTAFFGTPDSGMRASDNLFASGFHGAVLTSGGTVGPEGSIYTPIALLVVFALIAVRFRRPAIAT